MQANYKVIGWIPGPDLTFSGTSIISMLSWNFICRPRTLSKCHYKSKIKQLRLINVSSRLPCPSWQDRQACILNDEQWHETERELWYKIVWAVAWARAWAVAWVRVWAVVWDRAWAVAWDRARAVVWDRVRAVVWDRTWFVVWDRTWSVVWDRTWSVVWEIVSCGMR